MTAQQQRALAGVISYLDIAISKSAAEAQMAALSGRATDEQLVELASIPAVGAFIHAVREIAP